MIDIKNYFKTSSSNIEKLHIFEEKIIKISKEILNMTKAKKKLLVAGNGGSCSDAEHFVGELQCTYKKSNRSAISAKIPLLLQASDSKTPSSHRHIMSVEIVQASLASPRQVSTQACLSCAAQGHDPDAVHCKFCGDAL